MPDKKVTTAKAQQPVIEAHRNKMGAVKLSLKTYDPPKIDVAKPKDGIAQYGTDNRYPQHSIDHFKGSPTHSAICRWTAKLFAGNGFVFTGSDATEDWVKKLGYGQSIDRIGKRLALDLKLHNGYAMQVTWSKSGDKIVRISYQDFSHVRKLVDSNDATIAYLICKDWETSTTATTEGVRRIEAFDPEQVTEKLRDENGAIVVDTEGNEVVKIDETTGLPVIAQPNQLYYYEGACPGMVHYTFPEYVAADVCIEIDILFQDFHVNNILNGLLPSFILSFKGPEPEEEEKADFIKYVQDTFKGTKAKKAMVVWTGDEAGMETHVLDVKNNESRYLEVHKHCISQIISAHMLPSPMLAGIAGSGTLGGNAQELEAAWKLYAATVGIDGQDQLIEGMQHVFDFAGMDVTVGIIQRNPFEVEATTTVNEGGGDSTVESVTEATAQ